MGLSERKVKQRIGHDPRNLSWSDDKSRFSYQHMKALGWNDQSGIGRSGMEGNPNHIAVVQKLDNTGIGMARARKEGDELGGQHGQGLDEVLKRLTSASASPSPSPAPPSQEAPVSRSRIASRRKHIQSKKLASSSPAALAEILGIPVSQLPSPGVSADSPPISEAESEAPKEITTSSVSVSDYFRQKLRERAAARVQEVQPLILEQVVALTAVEPPVVEELFEVPGESKEDRKARKAEKRRLKQEKEEKRAAKRARKAA